MTHWLGTVNIIIFIVYVVVQFYPWFELCFLLFLGIVIYENEFVKKEKKFEPRIK